MYSTTIVNIQGYSNGQSIGAGIDNPFAAVGSYPGAVSYHEQRRCFAGSINEPQNLRMTRSGTESNMTYSIPVRDDDSINIRVAAREANTIDDVMDLLDAIESGGGRIAKA